MTSTDYTRTTGRKLTYRIRADERGGYVVLLNGKELMRGRDSLSAGGKREEPNKRKAVGAAQEARQAIEQLAFMNEF